MTSVWQVVLLGLMALLVIFVVSMAAWMFFVRRGEIEALCWERGGDRFTVNRSMSCWRNDGTRVFLD